MDRGEQEVLEKMSQQRRQRRNVQVAGGLGYGVQELKEENVTVGRK